METVRTASAVKILFGDGFQPIGRFKPQKKDERPGKQTEAASELSEQSSDQSSDKAEQKQAVVEDETAENDDEDEGFTLSGSALSGSATPFYQRAASGDDFRVTTLREATKLVPFYASMIQVLILTSDAEISRYLLVALRGFVMQCVPSTPIKDISPMHVEPWLDYLYARLRVAVLALFKPALPFDRVVHHCLSTYRYYNNRKPEKFVSFVIRLQSKVLLTQETLMPISDEAAYALATRCMSAEEELFAGTGARTLVDLIELFTGLPDTRFKDWDGSIRDGRGGWLPASDRIPSFRGDGSLLDSESRRSSAPVETRFVRTEVTKGVSTPMRRGVKPGEASSKRVYDKPASPSTVSSKSKISSHSESSSPSSGVCRNWAKEGSCRFGDKCKYPHPAPSKPSDDGVRRSARTVRTCAFCLRSGHHHMECRDRINQCDKQSPFAVKFMAMSDKDKLEQMRTRLASRSHSSSVVDVSFNNVHTSAENQRKMDTFIISKLDQGSPICAIQLVDSPNNVGGEVASLADLGNLSFDLMHRRYAKPDAKVIGQVQVRGATGISQVSDVVMVTLRFGGINYLRKTVLHTGNFPRNAHHVLSASTMLAVRADVTALLLGKHEVGALPYLPLVSKEYSSQPLRSSNLKVGEMETKLQLKAKQHGKQRRVVFGTDASLGKSKGKPIIPRTDLQPMPGEQSRFSRAMDPYSDPPLDVADDTEEIRPMLVSPYNSLIDDSPSMGNIMDEWVGWTDLREVIQGSDGVKTIQGEGTRGAVDPSYPQPFLCALDGPKERLDMNSHRSKSVFGTSSPLQANLSDFLQDSGKVDLQHSQTGLNGAPGNSRLIDCFVSEPVVRKYYEQVEPGWQSSPSMGSGFGKVFGGCFER